MIPGELTKKAWGAYVWDSNTQAIRNELDYLDLRGPMPPPPDTRQSVIAAIQAVAADIWDQGYAACYARQLQSDRWPYPDEDERAEKEYAEACGRDAATRAPNPYRASETA